MGGKWIDYTTPLPKTIVLTEITKHKQFIYEDYERVGKQKSTNSNERAGIVARYRVNEGKREYAIRLGCEKGFTYLFTIMQKIWE